MTNEVPDDFADFLTWLKARTEAVWADFSTRSLEEFRADGVGGRSWRRGTRWRPGLDGSEIEAIERRRGLGFPQDYRRFLSVLNAPDRNMYAVGWSDDPPYDLDETGDEPSFFDWSRDDEAIARALAWPLEGLLFDVEDNGFWSGSWGPRPETAAARRDRVGALVAAAPPLVPVVGHRYLLAGSARPGNPVLSVWQSDIIVYGPDLRGLLLLELADLLGLDRDAVEASASPGPSREAISAIPFWGELILGNG